MKGKKGFTLVEIMIVVGIIAILAGIFLVGAGGFRNAANDARRKSDLQTVASLQELCATKTGTYAASETALQACLPSTSIPADPVTKAQYTIGSTSASATLSDGTTYTINYNQ